MIPELEIDCESEAKRIEDFISEVVRNSGKDGLVLGLSGGLDSSVVAVLAMNALGNENVLALLMPERDSSNESVDDALLLCDRFGIKHELIDLEPALRELRCYDNMPSKLIRLRGGARYAVKAFPALAQKGYLSSLKGEGHREFREFIAFYRIKHRLRMVMIFHEAERLNMLATSCANRTEFEVGFFVKYGDDSGDIAPIKHLYKTQVFQLAEYLGIPEVIINKKPSPDLFAGIADEEIMGIDYRTLDSILSCISLGETLDAIVEKLNVSEKKVQFVFDAIEASEPLRSFPVSLPGQWE